MSERKALVARLRERYEIIRRFCLAHGNLHPDDKSVCHRALGRTASGLERVMAGLLDDMMLALTAPQLDGVVVPREVVLFLLGEGPLEEDVWWGEDVPGYSRYWWRKPLRAALLAAAKEPR